jgi:hypothetical protein
LDDIDFLARPAKDSKSTTGKYDKQERDREKSEKDNSEKRSTANVFKLQTGRLKIARRTSNEDSKDEKLASEGGSGVVASPRSEAIDETSADKYVQYDGDPGRACELN